MSSSDRAAPQVTDAIPHTICDAFLRTVARYPDRPAIGKVNGSQVESLTYREYAQRVTALAAALRARGYAREDRVMILSENRMEWAITDLACLFLGIQTVPVYTTLPTSQVVYLACDSGARAAFVSNATLLKRLLAVQAQEPALVDLFVFDTGEELPPEATPFTTLLAEGDQAGPDLLTQLAPETHPDDPATVIYTSGTTGEPKGALLTHRNIMSNIEGTHRLILPNEYDVFLSFLPLSHVFERSPGHFLPLTFGCSVVYCTSIYSVQHDLATVQPTVMLSVPRFFDSIRNRILDKVAHAPAARQRLFHWATDVGRRCSQLTRTGAKPNPLLAGQLRLADKLVLSKIRAVAGGRIRYFVSGGAALSVETAEFFLSLGFCMIEGYGLTETSPVLAANMPECPTPGTVGRPLPNIEIRIAEDGEILARGASIMKGYLHKPAETAEVIDADGWFYTGDTGCFDPQGNLKITGRKKEIIVLANGKNVAPVRVEEALRESPFISEVVVYGDELQYLIALIYPDPEQLTRWAAEQGIDTSSVSAITAHPKCKALFKQEIASRSKELAEFERVKQFAFIDQPFTVDTGELTPTLKLKRHVIKLKYQHLLEAMARE